MIVRNENYKSYNLYTIKTDKFRTIHIEIIFRNNLIPSDITIRNLLFDVLLENNKTFKSNRLLNLKLEDLYNASIYVSNNKVGSSIMSNICMDFLIPKYSDNKIIDDSIRLLFDIIFNPNVNNNEFDKQTVDYIKSRYESELKQIDDSPSKKAIINSLSNLGDVPASYPSSGNLEDLYKINSSNLYEYYKKVLDNDIVDIYVIGNADMDVLSGAIKKYNKFNVIKNHNISVYSKEVKHKLIKSSDNSLFNQSQVVMFLSLHNLSDFEKNYVANLYNMILGGGSLNTKLLSRLRMDNSLCYGVSSHYLKYDNLIMIKSGVCVGREDEAIGLIKDCIKDMGNNISNIEINNAKELTRTSLRLINDSSTRIVDNLLFNNLGLIDKLEDRFDNFDLVSIDDIYKLSKKIEICNIYYLGGKDE